MSWIDWTVLALTQLLIVGYGIWKSRGNKNAGDYYLGGRDMNWFTIGLSVMATQASAITFLSAPGQAYTDGMRFVQFYFGLPIAMVILSVTAVPLYHKLKVNTAYEFLEKRFDMKTRFAAAILFLMQRGLAAGFTIFAPALVLSSLMGWNIQITTIIIGIIVISYTVSGGTKAVSATQKIQMGVILAGMFFAAYLMIKMLPAEVGLGQALHIAGSMDKLNVVDFSFHPEDKYNMWSGLIGGLFLALAYFGTDQSQVGRYLSGASVAQSRLGLLFNGLLKVPMQFSILFIGAILYVFYLFQTPPVFFNKVLLNNTLQGPEKEKMIQLEKEHEKLWQLKNKIVTLAAVDLKTDDEIGYREKIADLKMLEAENKKIRKTVEETIIKSDPGADVNDTNYIFFGFVHDFLPIGMVGLIISVIFSASMSSTSSELNALASVSTFDLYKRLFKPEGTDRHFMLFSKLCTVFWGIYAVIFAMFANRLGTLIEAVNVLGSLVYGTVLGIFLCAFFLKKTKGDAVFYAALIVEVGVILLYIFDVMPFLWFNVVGALGVAILALLFQNTIFRKEILNSIRQPAD